MQFKDSLKISFMSAYFQHRSYVLVNILHEVYRIRQKRQKELSDWPYRKCSIAGGRNSATVPSLFLPMVTFFEGDKD